MFVIDGEKHLNLVIYKRLWVIYKKMQYLEFLVEEILQVPTI